MLTSAAAISREALVIMPWYSKNMPTTGLAGQPKQTHAVYTGIYKGYSYKANLS